MRRRRDREAAQMAADVVRQVIEAQAKPLVDRYIKRALGKNADRVLIHAIDKLLPEIKSDTDKTAIAIQIIHQGDTRADVGSNGKGNGLAIHIGGD